MKPQVAVVPISFIFLCLCLSALGQTSRMDDHSDWWSILNEHSRGPRIKPSGHDLDARNFEIAKLDLAKVSFADIAARLGRAARIRRGDASSSREQACYVSAHGSMPTYLIFEFGEDVSNFYLFADGEGWKGRSSCAKSEQLSSDTSTFSGLRLGLTLEQFKAILGQPDSTADSELVYSRAVKTKSTPEQFERQRKEYPDALSDRVAHEKFDFYTVSLYIEGRFTDSKLSYLAVSKSGE